LKIEVRKKCMCILSLLGMFAKLRKASISFVMSVGLSVSPHETTWSPQDGFLLHFIFK